MKWDSFAKWLPTVANVKELDGGGRTPRQPIDLHGVLALIADNDDELQSLRAMEILTASRYADPDAALKMLGEPFAIGPLLSWEWDGNMISWLTSLVCLDTGDDRLYVCFRADEQPLRLIAAFQRGSGDEASGFAERFTGSNGSAYGVSVSSCLPTRLVNSQPDLISESALREGVWRFVSEIIALGGESWENILKNGLASFSADPFEAARRASMPDRSIRPPADHEKKVLLDTYFRQHYMC